MNLFDTTRGPIMIKRGAAFLIALAALGCAAGHSANAIQTPEQLYREAYQSAREAKLADYNGNADLAGWKWGQAKMLLEKIQRDYPHWNREVVRGQLGEALERSMKVQPSPRRAFDAAVIDTRGLAAQIEEFSGKKAAMLKQMEWERKKLLDIEKYSRDLARKENARQILGIERGAIITLADIRRAEAREATPTPAARGRNEKPEKAAAQNQEAQAAQREIDSADAMVQEAEVAVDDVETEYDQEFNSLRKEVDIAKGYLKEAEMAFDREDYNLAKDKAIKSYDDAKRARDKAQTGEYPG